MPKHPIRKTKKSPKRSFIKYLKSNPKERVAFIILIGIAVVLLSTWATVTYTHHETQQAISKERAMYMQAKNTTGFLAKNIVQNVGAPDSLYEIQNCSRPNEEFTPGPLGCEVGTVIVYGASSVEDVNRIVLRSKKVEGQYINHIGAQAKSDEIKFGSLKGESDSYTKSIGIRAVDSKLSCSVGYTYFDSRRPLDAFGHKISSGKAQTLLINISCSGPALDTYFPVTGN